MKRILVLSLLCMSAALSAMGRFTDGFFALGEAVESDFAGYKRSLVAPEHPQQRVAGLLGLIDKLVGKESPMGQDGYRYFFFLYRGNEGMGSLEMQKFEGANVYKAVYCNAQGDCRDIAKKDLAGVYLLFKNHQKKEHMASL